MFIELYKFSKLVMHLNSCSMDLSRDKLGLCLCSVAYRLPISYSPLLLISWCIFLGGGIVRESLSSNS